MSVTFIEVTEANSGQRLDNFLITQLKGVPKSKIYNIIRKGEVRVNKGRVRPTHRLSEGDSVRIPPLQKAAPRELHLSDSLRSLLAGSILYEDNYWLVVNKPNGLAVHGGSGVSAGLIESLRLLRPDCHSLELCHRLDRPTSGCIVVAKRRSALRRFHQALREKTMQKRYQVVVAGRWSENIESVNLALQKNILASGERMVKVDASGKRSLTHFRVLKRFSGFSLLEAEPVTGRTHQIRVHCQAMGHPIVGDDKYGQRDANRKAAELGFRELFLHAGSIALPAMGESDLSEKTNWQEIKAPRPPFWQDFIRQQDI